MAMGQPGTAPTRSCVACGRAIAWDVNVCPYCGHDYRPQMAGMQQPMYGQQQMPQHEAVSGGMKILLYLLSLIFWPIGIIVGAIYYGRPETKEVGKMCIILAILGVVLWVVCYFVAVALWWSTVWYY
jgi:zinc-ribbon domain